MSVQWKVRDAEADREGTSAAVILASRETVATAGIGTTVAGWKHPYITLISGDITRGVVVLAIQPGAGAIQLDPLLRHELNV